MHIANENSPSGETEGVKAKADGLFAHSEFTGNINLTQISEGSPNPRYQVYLAGWTHGWEQREPEIERLRWERDLYYFLMSNRGKTAADFYARVTDALWKEAGA